MPRKRRTPLPASPDGIAIASAAIWPLIAKENEARREASKFDKAKASQAAKARHAVETKSSPPQKQDTKAKDARSTVGKVAAKAGGTLPAAAPLKLSPEAEALYGKIASGWELSPAVEALLTLACQAITKAGEAEAITAREGMTIGDAKGAAKPHPAALLARDYRGQAGTCLQRLLAHLEGR